MKASNVVVFTVGKGNVWNYQEYSNSPIGANFEAAVFRGYFFYETIVPIETSKVAILF